VIKRRLGKERYRLEVIGLTAHIIFFCVWRVARIPLYRVSVPAKACVGSRQCPCAVSRYFVARIPPSGVARIPL
jgi:hypothetical protein